jgi:hypothetical protein
MLLICIGTVRSAWFVLAIAAVAATEGAAQTMNPATAYLLRNQGPEAYEIPFSRPDSGIGESDDSGKESRTILSGNWYIAFQSGIENGNNVSRFRLTRGYITIIRKFNSSITGRITPDISVDQEGDGEGDVELRLKYCYFQYRFPDFGFFHSPYLEFGLVHRPWLEFEQKVNPFRAQGEMYLARNGIINSADYGVVWFANLGKELDAGSAARVGSHHIGKYGSLAIGIFNGGGYHAIEKNESKTLEGRFSWRPLSTFFPELQLTYHGATGKGNTRAEPDFRIHSAMLSLERSGFIVTCTAYTGRGNFSGSHVDSTGKALRQKGYSVFWKIAFLPRKWCLFGRWEHFQTPGYDFRDRGKRLILGIAYRFFPGCQFLMNYDRFFYDRPGEPDEKILELITELKF